MVIHNVLQGTPEWSALRAGIPTASEFDQIVTADWTLRKGEMLQTYLNRKLAEKRLGRPLDGKASSFEMEQGTMREDDAIPWYEMRFETVIDRPGFITTDDGRIGCSPDGMIGDLQLKLAAGWGGIEVKCPAAHTHTGWLRKGELPKDHAAQVHGCMLVTGAAWWKFLSFRPGFDPLLLTVNRDAEIQMALRGALNQFLELFDSEWKRLGWTAPKKAVRETAPDDFKSDVDLWKGCGS